MSFDLGVNLADPDTFAHGFPHDAFRRLRREAPVYWHAARHERSSKGFFVVSRYEDVKHVGRTPLVYSSKPGVTIVDEGADFEAGQSSMLQMDPPRHARYRKLVSAGFTPRRINALEPMIRQLANDILDETSAKGRVDYVTDVAAELPLRVIARFLGVPVEDRALLFSASNRLLGFEDAEYGTTEADGRQAAMDLAMLAYKIGEARKAAPEDDIITILLKAELDGDRLSEIDFIAFFVLLTIAGNETTRNQTSHTLRLLLEHPAELEKLRADPSLLPSAIEEALRFSPPVMYFRRTTTADTELRGVPIPQGSYVAIYYPSANRDEDVFPDADTFDITRTPNEHLAFGDGEHFCLGASLARLQLRCMVGETLRRFGTIELDGEIDLLRSHFIDGVKHMPVRLADPR
jgi:cholest-4-en-3-one 26-monooxygenase